MYLRMYVYLGFSGTVNLLQVWGSIEFYNWNEIARTGIPTSNSNKPQTKKLPDFRWCQTPLLGISSNLSWKCQSVSLSPSFGISQSKKGSRGYNSTKTYANNSEASTFLVEIHLWSVVTTYTQEQLIWNLVLFTITNSNKVPESKSCKV